MTRILGLLSSLAKPTVVAAHVTLLKRLTVPVSLLFSIAAYGGAASTQPDIADELTDTAAIVGEITGLRLEDRDGWGPFFIRTSPLVEHNYPPAQDFPSTEWNCEDRKVYAPADIVAIVWSGCSVDHLDRLQDPAAYAGDFDVAALFVRRDAGSVDLQMWVDNRLTVGSTDFVT